MMTIEIVITLGFAIITAVAITMVLMDRADRQIVRKELLNEIAILRDALKMISETHNQLTKLNAQNREDIEDLMTKLSILQQGIAPQKESIYGRRT